MFVFRAEKAFGPGEKIAQGIVALRAVKAEVNISAGIGDYAFNVFCYDHVDKPGAKGEKFRVLAGFINRQGHRPSGKGGGCHAQSHEKNSTEQGGDVF